MYNLIIKVHVWRNLEKTELGANLQLKLNVPFVPFAGLTILKDNISVDITNVEWRSDENTFYCTVRERTISGVGHEHFTFDELINEMQQLGWELRGTAIQGRFIEDEKNV